MAKKTKNQVEQPSIQGPNSSFRMKKEYKRRLALSKNRAVESTLRRMFISAQLAEESASMRMQKGYLEMFKGG